MKKLIITLCILFWIQNLQADIQITLEHVATPDQQTWGLMQRRELSENHGMAFTYPGLEYRSFWMFNTLIDLSLAFLDENKTIREIHELKAYPEVMDRKRPVKNFKDLGLYSENEPIVRFFLNKSVHSSFPTKYALEMSKDWFTNNGVQVGDKVVWEITSPNGYIVRRK